VVDTVQLVLGTAGHIDHGKTSLVRALTGIDCDRLPEERARGITIDLGFAHLDLDGIRFGIVDVPGHERFVHNMVAGATGVDVALLVVACDDSVMPQTVEHLAILELLGLRRGVIALTKCDLADDEQLALVRADVAEATQSTFLERARMVPVSVVTGHGLRELCAALVEAACHCQQQVERHHDSRTGSPDRDHFFRLPVDRVFTLHGHGTVVTGTVRSGTVRAGATLELLPERRSVRVRRLQTHGSDVESVSAGQRAAVNLAAVKIEEVHRGDELVLPGCLEPTRRLLVKVRVLPSGKRPLVHRRLVRLHLAAREVTARVLLEQREIAPGQTGYAVLLCESPVVAEYGQRFVLRRLSPVETLGGGAVLGPAPRRVRTRHLLESAAALDNPDPAERTVAFLAGRGDDALSAPTLVAHAGVDAGARSGVLHELLASGRILRTPGTTDRFLHPSYHARLHGRLLRRVDHELERLRPARFVPVAPVLTAAEQWTSRPVAEALLGELVREQRLVRRGDRIARAGELPRLTQRQQTALDRLIDACTTAGVAPPLLAEVAAESGITLKELAPLVQIAVDTRRLVRVNDDLAVTPAALGSLRTSALAYIAQHGPATVAQLRDQWQVTRKHAVPYLELFDRLGITTRAGDTRSAGPNAARALEEVLE
jgi:selenocysteine-specific elongation factor